MSPFMDMDMQYEWHLTQPGAQLSVAIVNSRGDERLFDVSLALERRELSRWTMLRALARYPWMTARVTQAIYWQAFRLWRKKCPFYPHPECIQRTEAGATMTDASAAYSRASPRPAGRFFDNRAATPRVAPSGEARRWPTGD